MRAAAHGALQGALRELDEAPLPLTRLFSLRHEFPSQWYELADRDTDASGMRRQAFPFDLDRFPFLLRGKKSTIQRITLLVAPKPGAKLNLDSLQVTSPQEELDLADGPEIEGLASKSAECSVELRAEPDKATWTIRLSTGQLSKLEDILVLVQYAAQYDLP